MGWYSDIKTLFVKFNFSTSIEMIYFLNLSSLLNKFLSIKKNEIIKGINMMKLSFKSLILFFISVHFIFATEQIKRTQFLLN